MSDRAQGSVFQQTIAAALTSIAQVRSINFQSDRDSIDISHLAGGVQRDFIPGLIDPGTVDLTLWFDPNGTTHQAITDEYILTANNACKIIWSDASEQVLTCFVAGVGESAELGGALEMTAKYKVADAVAFLT